MPIEPLHAQAESNLAFIRDPRDPNLRIDRLTGGMRPKRLRKTPRYRAG